MLNFLKRLFPKKEKYQINTYYDQYIYYALETLQDMGVEEVPKNIKDAKRIFGKELIKLLDYIYLNYNDIHAGYDGFFYGSGHCGSYDCHNFNYDLNNDNWVSFEIQYHNETSWPIPNQIRGQILTGKSNGSLLNFCTFKDQKIITARIKKYEDRLQKMKKEYWEEENELHID